MSGNYSACEVGIVATKERAILMRSIASTNHVVIMKSPREYELSIGIDDVFANDAVLAAGCGGGFLLV